MVESKKIPTNLKNKKLEDRMSSVAECSASHLLNGVNHIWLEEINACQDDALDDNGELGESIAKISTQEKAMQRIQVQEASEERGESGDSEGETIAGVVGGGCLPEFCLASAWDAGEKKMSAENYIQAKATKEERANRKRAVSKFIIAKVKEMEQEEDTAVGVERTDVALAPWTQLVHGLDPQYYN